MKTMIIGCNSIKQRIQIQTQACKNGGFIFPHTLLYSIGGLGKTILARAIGVELAYHFVEVHAASFKTRDHLLLALKEHSQASKRKTLLFFIDEIHRLSLPLQEVLYTAMKEWWLATRDGPCHISPFTLIGATTRFDMLDSNSFVTRFGNRWEIERYPLREIQQIVAYELCKQGFQYTSEVTLQIAQRCLGIPRNACSLSEKVIFTALAENRHNITVSDCLKTFILENIDYQGLGQVHHRYLEILSKSSGNGRFLPLGVGAISAKMRQPEDVIKGSIEPILLELDFVSPTPRGRILTDLGFSFLEKIKKSA